MAGVRSGDSEDPVNPYAASAVAESQEVPASSSLPALPRTYHVEMQWADRRRFLKTVGLLRFAAIAGAVLGFYALYGILMSFYLSLRIGTFVTWLEPSFAGQWLLNLAKIGLVFYSCWLQWTLANAMAATAGGTTGSMTVWSQIQRQVAILAIVTLAAGVLTPAWEWLTMQFFFSGINR